MIKLAIPALSLGLYLSFAAFNSRHIAFSEITLWSLFALAIGFIAFLIAWKTSKNKNTQTIVGFLLLLGFYSYGYIFKDTGEISKTSILLKALYFGLIPLIVYIVKGWNFKRIWKPFIIAVSLVSIIYPATMITLPPKVNGVMAEDEQTILDRSIYILVLDRYTRADILERYFGFDNSPFLDELEARGFSIAEDSRTNYNMTSTAFGSMLNFEYLDTLLPDIAEDEQSYVPLYDLYNGSRLERLAGDSWVSLGSWWKGIEDSNFLLGEYPSKMLMSTMLRPIIYLYDKWANDQYIAENTKELSGNIMIYTKEWSRHLLLHQFGILNQLAKSPGNELIIAHVISPHPPYCFDIDGNLPDSNLPNEELYLGQLQYTNKLILDWLDNVPNDAAIILTADEGAKGLGYVQGDAQTIGDFTNEEKLEMHQSILMAVRGFELYPGITSVNMMRLLANSYLGLDLELLEDKVFNIDHNYPYRWK